MSKKSISIIGGGLAGCEAAWQLAERGHAVNIFEMRPKRMTGAHHTEILGELVCSNSLGSSLVNRPSGLLQQELVKLGSKLIECAKKVSLPAGSALAVDRDMFARLVQESILAHPNIELIREEVTQIPIGYSIIASGPLTSAKFESELSKYLGENNLYFFDALAPIVSADSINRDIAYKGSRYDRGLNADGDYINCPFSREQYDRFVDALIHADVVQQVSIVKENSRVQKKSSFFEGCLPIEVLAKRGKNSLAFGPMRPMGLRNDKSGKHPYAIVQLRQDNLAANLYNIVGFQTNLTYTAQSKVFQLIPGLENAIFVRFGQMHRNTFINSPSLLMPTLQLKSNNQTFFAGQLSGIEGYVGSIASGLVAGINMSLLLESKPPLIFPRNTMVGSLLWYISHAEQSTFQPMKANFGLLPPLSEIIKNKDDRNHLFAKRCLESLEIFIDENQISK